MHLWDRGQRGWPLATPVADTSQSCLATRRRSGKEGHATGTIRAQILGTTEAAILPAAIQLDGPKADEVVLDIAACCVCHTDLHVIKEEVALPRPAVLGHEVSGIIVEIGDGVDHVAPGDRVVASFIMPCGECRHCRNGLEEICEVFFNH